MGWAVIQISLSRIRVPAQLDRLVSFEIHHWCIGTNAILRPDIIMHGNVTIPSKVLRPPTSSKEMVGESFVVMEFE